MIPDARPVYLATGSMFDHETVYFGRARQEHLVCPSRGAAELVARIAELGLSGRHLLPMDDNKAMGLLDDLNERLEEARSRMKKIVESRTGDSEMQAEVLKLLEWWFVLGKAALA